MMLKMTMFKLLFSVFYLCLVSLIAFGQQDENYLKANAIQIDQPTKLNTDIYTLLSPYNIIMLGEMHGTNESAPFASGLINLFTSQGDSVLFGLEIPPLLMAKYVSSQTDSSIYQSDFFNNPPFMDGKQSVPWANLLASCTKNPRVKLFFFDANPNEGKSYQRDSIMAFKIKTQFNQKPNFKMITLGGNYHNIITDFATMASILKSNIDAKICSLNMEYKSGSANANFGHGLEIKQLDSLPSAYNSTEGYDNYLLLWSKYFYNNYDGIYYTKYITAAKMVRQ